MVGNSASDLNAPRYDPVWGIFASAYFQYGAASARNPFGWPGGSSGGTQDTCSLPSLLLKR